MNVHLKSNNFLFLWRKSWASWFWFQKSHICKFLEHIGRSTNWLFRSTELSFYKNLRRYWSWLILWSNHGKSFSKTTQVSGLSIGSSFQLIDLTWNWFKTVTFLFIGSLSTDFLFYLSFCHFFFSYNDSCSWRIYPSKCLPKILQRNLELLVRVKWVIQNLIILFFTPKIKKINETFSP